MAFEGENPSVRTNSLCRLFSTDKQKRRGKTDCLKPKTCQLEGENTCLRKTWPGCCQSPQVGSESTTYNVHDTAKRELRIIFSGHRRFLLFLLGNLWVAGSNPASDAECVRVAQTAEQETIIPSALSFYGRCS